MSFDLKISKSSEEFTPVQLLLDITGHKDLLYLVYIQKMPVVSTCLAGKKLHWLPSFSVLKAIDKRASYFINFDT